MSPMGRRKMCHKNWITTTTIWLLCFTDIWTRNWINANALPDENGPLSEVQTAVGFEVSLPCDLIPASSILIQDKVTLVIWYKEGNAKPIYTFDARGKPLQQAVHWADQEVFTTKAHFYYDTHPPSLRIKSIKREDAGVYRCRVDFQKSPTRNWRINLSVLVPPTQLVILDHMGATHSDGAIGPYREGATFNITCLSSGGIPAPRVSWWREHALLDDSFQVLPDGSVRNVLQVPKLSRHDLMTVYTCQASNGHVVPPLSSTVKVDMRLPPLFVRLQGLNHPLVSGVRTQATCTSAGARPSPQIVWNKGGILMRGATQTTSTDGNMTVSELVFLPVPEDNGKLVTCSVTTDSVAGVGTGVFLKDSRPLDVKHAPIVSLSLGAPLDSDNLMKGTDVYLECDIKANPPAKRVEWFHNDRQLFSSRGIIIANQTLVLQGIAKATHGQYMCRAMNPQGTVGSNEVYLDVKYPPVCLAEATVIKAAIKQTVNVSCGIDSNPTANLSFKWTFNNTLENIVDLPGVDTIYANEAATAAPQLASYDDPSYTEPMYSNSVVQAPNGRHRYHGHQTNEVAERYTTTARPVLPANVYPYRVESFQHFGTISCVAQNAIGQSAPCLYHIMAAEVPDPVRNCSASNSSANSVQIACIPGQNGGIQQFYHVEVFDENTRSVLYNTSFRHPEFTVKRLPSDTAFRVQVTAFNLQGPANAGVRVYIRTLPAPLLRTASSTALVELTPLLSVLLGMVGTLALVAICIVIFVKARSKRPRGNSSDNPATEPDKGSAEPLSRNMGSHSSLEEKNPDVVPHEANSDDEYTSEEKAFDRLHHTNGTHPEPTHRIIYSPHISSSPPPLSPTSAFASIAATKPYGELSLTTNPAYALYNSPQRRPPPLYSSPKQLLVGNNLNNSNIYTRVPTRPFIPYDSRLSPTSYDSRTSPTYASSIGGTSLTSTTTTAAAMPLLLQQQQQQQTTPNYSLKGHMLQHQHLGSAVTLAAGSEDHS